MRVVFDPNVIISATLSPAGSPARAYRLWRGGAFDLVVSPQLMWELEGVLRRDKFKNRIHPDEVDALVVVLNADALLMTDPDGEPDVGSRDPDDDYLIALADKARAILVSGDDDLLELSSLIPVYSPAKYLEFIAERD